LHENTSDVWSFTTESSEDPDPGDPTLEITKPRKGSIHVFNKYIRKAFFTVIIGKIDITADVIGPSGDTITKVNFYVRDDLMESQDYDPETITYRYTWNKIRFGIHNIRVSALDSEDNVIVEQSMRVIKIL
jgi:hypothetical protein